MKFNSVEDLLLCLRHETVSLAGCYLFIFMAIYDDSKN